MHVKLVYGFGFDKTITGPAITVNVWQDEEEVEICLDPSRARALKDSISELLGSIDETREERKRENL